MNIVKQNNEYRFFNEVEIHDKLEPKNYEMDYEPTGELFIKTTKGFSFPEKMFDIDKTFRTQVIKSFKSIDSNMGVLLAGYKGQGKTVTAKLLCEELSLPVIIINKKIPAKVDFPSLINKIQQDCIIFIDEFEKIFEKHFYNSDAGNNDSYHSQESFLTLMDGAFNSKHKRLFIFTANDAIHDKFISRPSRIRYFKSYNFMSQELYNMIIEDTLKNRDYEADLRDNLPLVNASVDLLKAIIEEINIHNIPYSQFMDYFNFRPKTVTYQQEELSENGKDWRWVGSFESMGEINRDSTFINDHRNCKVTDIVGDYIYYRVTSTESNIKGKKRSFTNYRLKRINDLTLMYGDPSKIAF